MQTKRACSSAMMKSNNFGMKSILNGLQQRAKLCINQLTASFQWKKAISYLDSNHIIEKNTWQQLTWDQHCPRAQWELQNGIRTFRNKALYCFLDNPHRKNPILVFPVQWELCLRLRKNLKKNHGIQFNRFYKCVSEWRWWNNNENLKLNLD